MADSNETTGASSAGADGSRSEFQLHPELEAWINRESNRLVSLVEDLTEMALRNRAVIPHPDLPIDMVSEREIIGEPKSSILDGAGRIIAHFYPNGRRFLGLKDAAIADAQKIAERIWSRSELRDILSVTTILELLLDYVGASARGIPTPLLSDKIIQKVTESVRRVSIWVPIEEVLVDGEFSFASAVLAPLSRDQLDAVLDDGGFQAISEEVRQFRGKLHSKWSGRTVMRFELVAEPKRAGEIAGERAADYMSLLQIFASPALILPLVSHVAPRGARPYGEEEYIVSAPKFFTRMGRLTGPTYQLVINAESRAMMEQLGLRTVSRLAQGTSCEYEEKLLDSLLIYGRACYQVDPNDKFLQVMTAIEMFCLKSDGEPIQGPVGERIAFAVSGDPNTRQAIVQNFKTAYSLRSGRTHHGKSITETGIIEEFLRNAWSFFLMAIDNVGRFQTRMQFLEYLDGIKYGRQEQGT